MKGKSQEKPTDILYHVISDQDQVNKSQFMNNLRHDTTHPNACTSTSHKTRVTSSPTTLNVTWRPLAGGLQRNTRKSFFGKCVLFLHKWLGDVIFLELFMAMLKSVFEQQLNPRKHLYCVYVVILQ